MSGYDISVILEDGGITVGRIAGESGELRVVAREGISLFGAPVAAVRRLAEVAYAYYTAGDGRHHPAGICFGLTTDAKRQQTAANIARTVIDAVQRELQ
jgi:hypothetical protein